MTIQFNHLPVTPLRITSRFGSRNTGIAGASAYHQGIDLGRDFNREETPVQSVAPGVVANSYWNQVRGWVVIIDHGSFKTLYQHLKGQGPPKGTMLSAGQQIGMMGASTQTIKGMAVHLHMELIAEGRPIDPEPYLNKIQEVKGLTEAEVRAIIKEMLEGSGDTPSSWAKKEWDNAKREGVTDGTRPQGYCTREQVVTMMERRDSKK